MLITNDDGNVLNDTFIDLASKAKNIIIASGYLVPVRLRKQNHF